MDGTVSRLRGTHPTLLLLRRDDRERVAGVAQRVDEFVEEDAVEPVVVGDEKFHGHHTEIARRLSQSKRK
jgi:hypothetical protein